MDSAPQDARLSNYRLERLLGAGGMGSVYLAHDLVLDRAVAIKFIASERAADDSARRRLIREARAAAALDHPNICSVHDVIVDANGRACIVMQYVEGETLAQVLRRGPLDVRLALTLTADLASALAAAHARGIIHRDLKPQNIIVTPERRAKLLDFGIARQADLPAGSDEATATSLTGPGAMVGTPAYMSPEQAQQLPLDGRTDLFTLGAVLFECLTGRRAFEGDTPLRVATQVLEHDPPPVSSLRPELSEQHDELCRRLLAKHPDDRFKSADELLGALRVLMPETGRHPRAGDIRAAPGGPGWSALALAGVRPFRPARVAVAVAAILVVAAAAVARDAGLWVWRPAATSSTPVVIGVLPFVNDSADARHDPTVAGLTKALATRLRSVAPLRVLSADEIRDAIRELRTAGDARPDAAAVARSLAAGFVIDGTMVRSGSTFEVIADLVRPDGERLSLGSYAAEGGPLDLQRRLAEGLILALRNAAVVAEIDQPVPPTENADAFAEYSQARVFLERPDVPGNLDHAIRLFQGAIAKDPEFALAHAGLAEAYWAQFGETKNPEWTTKAMAANLDALKIDPTQAEVRMSLAVMYHAQGRRNEAVEELKAVMALQPQNDHVHRLLSDIHSDLGEWDAAIAEALQAAALRGSYWRNHSQLGYAYLLAGRFDDAARAYSRVTELQPDSPRGYQMLGTALQKAGRNDEALVEYEKAIRIGASWGTYSNVGTLYFWRGNYQKAADNFEKALERQPSNPALHVNLGDAYTRLGQPGRAVQSYRRAMDHVRKLLAVSPNDSSDLAVLALAQAKLGDRDVAAATLQKAVAASPRDGQVLFAASIVHALAGNGGSACRALAEALEQGASAEEIRHAGELRTLKACPAYDAVMQNVK